MSDYDQNNNDVIAAILEVILNKGPYTRDVNYAQNADFTHSIKILHFFYCKIEEIVFLPLLQFLRVTLCN